MKFSGNMCLKIILKVTKNQGFTFSLEDTFFEKPQEGRFRVKKERRNTNDSNNSDNNLINILTFGDMLIKDFSKNSYYLGKVFGRMTEILVN